MATVPIKTAARGSSLELNNDGNPITYVSIHDVTEPKEQICRINHKVLQLQPDYAETKTQSGAEAVI